MKPSVLYHRRPKKSENFFSYRRGPIGNFFQFFFQFLWPRYSSSTSRMTKYLLLTIDNEISRGRSPWGKISKRRTETEAGRRRIKSVPRALVINRGSTWKWTALGKVDGPTGWKWMVQSPKTGRSWVKVNGTKRHKVDGPQKMKPNGPKINVGGQKGMKVDGPEKCVGN